ncbi:hypothetical protein [Prosthecobacter sp.]|uniref:hypothetical protein n=1 Tax=Prosthecobacter sp. TaxID=1965333 RepID=UPI00378428AC
MTPILQVFADREAARAELQSSSYRNFLIIAPVSVGDSPDYDEQVAALARQFSREGYTYVARCGQKEMEDDPAGVRYLPLREALPSFGQMNAVVVAGDHSWAARAADEYRGADVFLLQPALSAPAQQRQQRRKNAALPAGEALQGAA